MFRTFFDDLGHMDAVQPLIEGLYHKATPVISRVQKIQGPLYLVEQAAAAQISQPLFEALQSEQMWHLGTGSAVDILRVGGFGNRSFL